MINAISTSQNDYSLVVTAENSENAKKGEPKPLYGESERPEEEKVGYKLSLSDENWKTLGKKQDQEELSEDDLRKVEELKKIDKKVHTHEQAHLSAAGGYARGGAQYDYVRGPDGNKYANSGHVSLDTSREKKPEATIKKANIIQKAALAPADPSPADKQIAANAAKMAADAQQELAETKKPESTESKGSVSNSSKSSPDAPEAPEVATVSESTG